jgi:hypothetical protein
MGVGGKHHAPATLPPGMTCYPLYRRLGEPHGRSGRVQRISPPTGAPVASGYNEQHKKVLRSGYDHIQEK